MSAVIIVGIIFYFLGYRTGRLASKRSLLEEINKETDDF